MADYTKARNRVKRWNLSDLVAIKWMPRERTDSRGLKGNEVLVLHELIRHLQSDFSCYPSHQRLAALTGLCRHTVIRTLASIERKGWITIQSRRGRKHTCHYTIHIEEILSEINVPICDIFQDSTGEKMSQIGTFSEHKMSHFVAENVTNCDMNKIKNKVKGGGGTPVHADTEPADMPPPPSFKSDFSNLSEAELADVRARKLDHLEACRRERCRPSKLARAESAFNAVDHQLKIRKQRRRIKAALPELKKLREDYLRTSSQHDRSAVKWQWDDYIALRPYLCHREIDDPWTHRVEDWAAALKPAV